MKIVVDDDIFMLKLYDEYKISYISVRYLLSLDLEEIDLELTISLLERYSNQLSNYELN